MSTKKNRPKQKAARATPPAHQALFLSAALIVKNEQSNIEACLGSLVDIADEIVVYDTGSTDATADMAEAMGAKVIRGDWPGNFAEARNRALAECSGMWVLSVDADETLVADPKKLRTLLRNPYNPPAYSVLIRNLHQDGSPPFDHNGPRLFRRQGTQWCGHIHELPSDKNGEPWEVTNLSGDVLMIMHHGYTDNQTVKDKCQRNSRIVRAELRRLAAEEEPPNSSHVARMLAHLTRTEEGRGDPFAALEVGAVLTEMFPDEPAWGQGVARLALLALAIGKPSTALPFIRRLKDSGISRNWAAFVESEALLALGRPEEAWPLVDKLPEEVIDPVGIHVREYTLYGRKAVCALLTGNIDRAAAEAVVCTKFEPAATVAGALAHDSKLTGEQVDAVTAAIARRSPELAGALDSLRHPAAA